MIKIHDITPFQVAAGRVRSRIGAITFARWIQQSHWMVGLLGVVLVLALRFLWEWRSGEVWVVAGLVAGWLLLGFLKGFFARPDALRALAIFDQKGEWKDQFSSAFFFLGKGRKLDQLSSGEKLHVSRTRGKLENALEALPQTLPLPALSKVWILPLLAILFAVSPFLRKEIQPGDARLTEEMIQSAALEADRIRKAARELNGLEALSNEEKVELQKLESSVDTAADEIGDPEGQTARDVLATLESRARAAERLAEKLGLHNEAWASEEFVRELSQHADTADLAIGIKDKNPILVADQSDVIAGVLKQDEIKRETVDRYTIALERSVAKSTDEDGSKPVGERIGNASRKMTARQPKFAAREFEELASHFRRVEKREIARKKLEKLAAQLRNSGSQISGSKLESLKKIADAPKSLPEGLKPVDAMPIAQQLQNLMAPQTPQPGQMGATPMPIPGSLGKSPDGGKQSGEGSQPGGKGGEEDAMTPIPGQSPGEGSDGKGIAMQPGGEGQKGGMLSAPIPGANPGSDSLGSALGSDAQGGTSAAAGGGNKAGSGTMDMFEQRSEIAKAEKESRIATQLNKEGDSEFRSVDGKSVKAEQAKLSRKDIMKEFIDVEEEALDEQTLPLTRRKQVLRYFSEIRRQLEEEAK